MIGAPGGICFGLKMLFGDAVHCFFAEPVDAPCMTPGLVTGKNDAVSVYDIGLANRTCADGLAVGRPSAFVGKLMKGLLAGCFTMQDDIPNVYQKLTRETENLKVEPSAAAGFPGPQEVIKSGFCEKYNISPESITHIIWTTGGRYLPEKP